MRIAVLYGGTSSERNVSLASGSAIAKALTTLGYTVRLIDTAYGSNQPSPNVTAVGERPPTQEELPNVPGRIGELLDILVTMNPDIVFNALHGGAGEDGRLQGLLELLGLSYTGSGVMASSAAMNKVTAKRIFQSVGVPTAEYLFFPRTHPMHLVREAVSDFGLPLVVKPNEEGSTVGLSLLHELSNFESAWSTATAFGDVLIERYIEGRELTVAVLGGEALPVIEIIPKGGFYDYHHKYTKGLTEYVCPAALDSDTAEEARQFAMRAFTSLQCRGYARVDFRLSPHGNLYCLEVNTLPGMTETSLVPKAAKAAGLGFEQLVEKIVQLGIKTV